MSFSLIKSCKPTTFHKSNASNMPKTFYYLGCSRFAVDLRAERLHNCMVRIKLQNTAASHVLSCPIICQSLRHTKLSFVRSNYAL